MRKTIALLAMVLLLISASSCQKEKDKEDGTSGATSSVTVGQHTTTDY